ncbi:MAG: flagellar biosynthetic protein FliO [Desulfitobacterium sp.]|nr:flagellar biosynthetic protein FliO [Desulfitobacterium sp.]
MSNFTLAFDENAPYRPPEVSSTPGTELTTFNGGLVITVLILFLILVLALWVIRKMNGITYRGMHAPWARVLDRQMLTSNQSLYLVEIAGKLQVLAATDHQITKIQEINDPEQALEILDEIAHRPIERREGVLATLAQGLFGGRRKGQESFEKELERLLEEVEK